MAILNQPITEGDSGFNKKFEAGSEALLFDFVQSAQYQFPIPSAIRELVTNCRDSIGEKEMFFAINSGKAQVSDYYIEQEGSIYQDSKYDPTYYNKRWLSKTENRIRLIYKVNNNAQRDTFHIIDTGVGLGRLRLEKSFNPLFSTKRLAKNQVGKFGLGSKSGLALQVDYYTIISRYNGMEFHFNVYDYKVDSTVPRFNTTTGDEYPFYEMETSTEKVNGVERPRRLHYYPTEEPNGVEVILQAKKGLRKDFIDAVKSQLLYLDGIEFELHEDGKILPQEVKAKIEYEDDVFVLASDDDTYYSKPHLILNGICYGYIAWLQLEEEEKVGNIGIKVDPSSVDVNPNRESVRWTEKTRNAIHAIFKQGEHIAERLVSESLLSTDIIDWLLKSAAAMGGVSSNSIISRFAQIVDVKSMKPKFQPMPKIRFDSNPTNFFAGYDVMLVTPKQKHSKAKQMQIASLEREDVYSWMHFSGKPIFYQDSSTSFRQEMFMLSLYPGGFVKIVPKGRTFEINEEREKLTKKEEELLSVSWEEWNKLDAGQKNAHFKLQCNKWEQDRALMDKLIRDSKFTEMYNSIEVPEGFSVYEKEDAEDTAEAVEKVMKEMSDAERRKLENKIVVQAFQSYDSGDTYWRRKQEPRIKEVLAESDLLVYGFQENEPTLQLVHQLMNVSAPGITSSTTSWGDTPVTKVVMVAQQNAKYFKPHMFVEDFFMSFNPETKTISMHNKLVKWQTARKINQQLTKLKFLTNFGLFDTKASELYRELQGYVNSNYVVLKGDATMLADLETWADQVTEFQLFVAEHKDNPEAIAAKSAALFQTNEEGSFKDAIGIEFEPYQKLQQLMEAAAPVQLLLNEVDCLTSSNTIPFNLEQEIKEYLEHKGYLSLSKTVSAPPLPVADTAELMEV